VLLHAFIFIAITYKTNYKLKLEKYCFLNIHTKKIKFVVKLVLFYMNICIYVVILHKKLLKTQWERNPSLQRSSQACATPRFSKTVLMKWYISNSINFESIFLKNG